MSAGLISEKLRLDHKTSTYESSKFEKMELSVFL